MTQGQIITAATAANGGTTLMSIADLGRVRMRVTIDEVEMGNIRVGLPATVAVDAFPERTFDGILEKIEPQAVVTQGVTFFPVMVSISNKEGLLMPGMNGEVTIKAADLKNVLQVPIDAIRATNELAPVARMFSIPVDTLTSQLRRDLVSTEGKTGIPGRYVVVELPDDIVRDATDQDRSDGSQGRTGDRRTEGRRQGGHARRDHRGEAGRLRRSSQIADNMKRGAAVSRAASGWRSSAASETAEAGGKASSVGEGNEAVKRRAHAIAIVAVWAVACRHAPPSIDGVAPTPASSSTLGNPRRALLARRARDTAAVRVLPDSIAHRLTLPEIVDLALRNSPATQMSWAQARSAADAYGSSEGRLYPTISAGIGVTRQLVVADTGPSGAGARADTGRRSISRTRCSTSAVAPARSTSRVRRRSPPISRTTRRSRTRFFRSKPPRSTISRRARSATRRRSRSTWRPPRSTRRTSGIALVSRRSPTCSRRGPRGRRPSLQLADARGSLLVTRGGLAVAMGLPANTPFEMPDIPAADSVHFVAQSVDSLIELAVRNRPELATARAQAAAAQSQIASRDRRDLPVA